MAALSSLLGPELLAAGFDQARDPKAGGLVGLPHFAPKAKAGHFFHQSGGPSQLETFDYKPGWQVSRHADSGLIRGPARRADDRTGRCPWPVRSFHSRSTGRRDMGERAAPAHREDRGRHHRDQDHEHGRDQSRPGHHVHPDRFQQPGRPSMGAWLSYGLGARDQNLPSFVVLCLKRTRSVRINHCSRLWASGFLGPATRGSASAPAARPCCFSRIHRA